MQLIFRCTFVLLVAVHLSCTTTRRPQPATKDDGKLELVFVQVNDVYEIAPVSGGKAGGMARVATLKKDWLKKNPNTFLVMAGDFVSPSIYNSLAHEGKRIRGKQMIESMNAAGTDIVIFGNHEFDIAEAELQERINESTFQWISSNSFHKQNVTVKPFEKRVNGKVFPFPKSKILTVTDADGTVAKIGLFGITLPFNKADYVSYTDPLATAREQYGQLKDSCDAVVAITHQELDDDTVLATEIPGLAMVIGGHEHDRKFEKKGNVYISKAHANAKSAYILRLLIDKHNKSTQTVPELKMLDETVALDSATDVVVQKWMKIANDNYASLGFDPKQVVVTSGDSLDGREIQVRSTQTNFTRLVAASMSAACPEADAAIMNAGSIRVDDILYPPSTQYDVLRSLPFGGPIREAEIKGSLLLQTLDVGRKNKGTGGFLHYHPIEYRASPSDPTQFEWILNGNRIDTGKVYRIAFSDFLVTGKEAKLEFLKKENPGMIKLYDPETSPASPKSDIRLAIVRYIASLNRK